MNRASHNQTDAVARAFERGAATYEMHDRVQRRTSQMLAARMAAFIGDEMPVRIVDLGCGTGGFTKELALRYPRAALLACDIAPSMIEKTKETLHSISEGKSGARFSVVQADAEFATFSPVPDVTASNLAMQWYTDPLASLEHHAKNTRFLAWTTLVEGTFAGWIEAHRSRGIAHGLREFMRAHQIVQICERLGASRVQCSIDRFDDHFPNAIEFLRDLRGLGATTARPGHEPAPLQGILRAFSDGFTAEYQVCTILLEMPKA